MELLCVDALRVDIGSLMECARVPEYPSNLNFFFFF